MSEVPRKSKLAAALVCFFVGFLGIHRFYLGHYGIGMAQALTCGGCCIWSLIDFLLILTDNVKDSEGRDLV